MIRTLLICVVLSGLALSGCRNQSAQRQADTTAAYTTYKLRGTVVNTNAATSEVTVNHQAIPGFMEAMTMAYKVKDASILSELHAGDIITSDLLVPKNETGDVVLDHVVIVGQGRPDYKPKASYHVPTPGDQVPNFTMKNQDGRVISVDQFHGKELLITFIYTRCPLPNFCPRVTRQFAEIRQKVSADPRLASRTHLLCVSFDPAHDTPARLRAYGVTYAGSDSKDTFATWDFAVPDQKTLDKMAQFFDLGLSQEPDTTITHTLSTTLIDADGKVVQFYPGNDWTVDEVMADLTKVAAKS